MNIKIQPLDLYVQFEHASLSNDVISCVLVMFFSRSILLLFPVWKLDKNCGADSQRSGDGCELTQYIHYKCSITMNNMMKYNILNRAV